MKSKLNIVMFAIGGSAAGIFSAWAVIWVIDFLPWPNHLGGC